MAVSGKVEWLSWKGYSEKKRVSLAGWLNGFAFPSRLFERVPYCIESYDILRDLESDDRLDIQRDLFERTDHSVMATAYMGIIRKNESDWLKGQLNICLKTMARLVQITAEDDIHGAELTKVLSSLPQASSAALKSALESSLYFYANGKMRKPFEKVMQHPLYLELGIDILANGLQFSLAEFQVRYATPYPHLLRNMSDSYAEIFPQLFQRFGLSKESFSQRRFQMFSECMDRFKNLTEEEPAKIVVDAWAYLENSGANLKATAREFGMDYIVFDDLTRAQNIYERAYRDRKLVIFNQPPLNLLDPSDDLFQRVNFEKLETYDELAWEGLLHRFINGQVFLANSPISDLVNDKALYSLIPDLCKLFFGQSVDLPIVDTMPCWSEEDYTKPNAQTLAWAIANKDKAVIAHRYLEGGLGIRVGPCTSKEEWDSFIETFVFDRPYLYVIRSYFPMDPDFSLRLLASMSLPEFRQDIQNASTEFSDTIFARLSTQSPLTTDNHRSFLIFPTGDAAAVPRYELEDDASIR